MTNPKAEVPGTAASEQSEAPPKIPRIRRLRAASLLRLAGMKSEHADRTQVAAGSSPGIESLENVDQPPPPGVVRVRCIDYGLEVVESREFATIDECLAAARPEGTSVRWINVDTLHPYVVNRLRTALNFHTLAAEDVLHTPQRPKVEPYDGHLFIVARMLTWQDERLRHEQLSIFLFKDIVVTFQEAVGDCWDSIRQRVQKSGSRLRTHDTSYLVYAMLDAVVDHCFPILENYGEILEQLEAEILESPEPRAQQRLHGVKRELGMLRRVVWPLRELLRELHHADTKEISPAVKTYMRDVHDHAVQVMDILETYRELAGGLNDLYMSAVGNRMNEIMKVLTIMASFFIPITFFAGVYGMNFEHLPELHWKYSYAVFWVVCLGIVGSLAYYFRRRGWLGGR